MAPFLWKKSKNSDLYIDLTTISGQTLISFGTDAIIDKLFIEAKSPQFQKNNLYAEIAREQGKTSFAEGNYAEAMHRFNMILSCAENDSDLIGIAYANRSACFWHFDMMEECLVDIALAKNANYPPNLMPKLEARLANSTKKLIDEEFKEKRFTPRKPVLSYNEHAEHAGVAECLEIRQSADFGRHITTTCDLNIGETILIEQPFSIFHKRFYKPSRDRCFHCFKMGMNFVTCKNCLGGLFCNQNCMETHRKYECNLPSALSRKETFELVLRMFYNINSAFPDVDFLMQTVDALLKFQAPIGLKSAAQRDFCLIFRLNHNHRKQSTAVLERFRAATSVAVNVLMRSRDIEQKYVTLKHRRFMNHLILHLLHIAEQSVDLHEYIETNNNQYSYENYARAIYPIGCYFNHSCVPNVAWYSVDGRLICKVIRPIKKNEQLFRSYLYVPLITYRLIC